MSFGQHLLLNSGLFCGSFFLNIRQQSVREYQRNTKELLEECQQWGN